MKGRKKEGEGEEKGGEERNEQKEGRKHGARERERERACWPRKHGKGRIRRREDERGSPRDE